MSQRQEVEEGDTRTWERAALERCSGGTRPVGVLGWAGTLGLPAAQVLCHRRPAAEQIGPERLQLLPQPHHGGQRLCVEVQYGVLLLDVDQGLFIHVLQELLGLLGHLQNKPWPSVLVNHPAFGTRPLCRGTILQ